MYTQIVNHLHEVILPFWKGLKDDVNGGYISYVDQQTLVRQPDAEKGCILNSRILWFFSQACVTLNDSSLLAYADHAYEMLCRMLDKEYGGVVWSLHADGTVSDFTKHTYNQAFAIYALSAYYQASGKTDALQYAMDLFHTIEAKCRDEISYVDASTIDFRPLENKKLSENGVIAEKTMNTLLHLLEAYTELFRVSQNDEIKQRLYFLLEKVEKNLYNPEKHRLEVFFDKEYRSLLDMHSYGHDIETAWLTDRTLEILDDDVITSRIRPILLDLVQETYRTAYTEKGFYNESVNGIVDTDRVWWVQSEAIVGFLNAYEKTGDKKYLEACRKLWLYIMEALVDRRPNSEWFWHADENGVPSPRGIVEPWKCPYHNGRMILEIISRKAGKEL